MRSLWGVTVSSPVALAITIILIVVVVAILVVLCIALTLQRQLHTNINESINNLTSDGEREETDCEESPETQSQESKSEAKREEKCPQHLPLNSEKEEGRKPSLGTPLSPASTVSAEEKDELRVHPACRDDAGVEQEVTSTSPVALPGPESCYKTSTIGVNMSDGKF